MDKIAFVFSGQGAQYTGMGKSLYESSKAARHIFDKAEELFPGIRDMCFYGTKEELSLTKNTQPATFVVSVAAASALEEAGISPDMAAGFSLGELSAAAYFGMLEFGDALLLVIERARLMQECAEKNPGIMGAVMRLDSDKVKALTQEFSQIYVANLNCPSQTVISSSGEEYPAFEERVKQEGGRIVRIPVNGAFHSPFMADAAGGLEGTLSKLEFKTPRVPLYSNVTAQVYGENPAQLLKSQITSPVLWEAAVRNMESAGAKIFIECGPGKTLLSLIKKTIPDAVTFNTDNAEELMKTVQAIKEKNQC